MRKVAWFVFIISIISTPFFVDWLLSFYIISGVIFYLIIGSSIDVSSLRKTKSIRKESIFLLEYFFLPAKHIVSILLNGKR